jgi:hypothetical protein
MLKPLHKNVKIMLNHMLKLTYGLTLFRLIFITWGSYPKIVKKDIPLSLFWAGYVEGYDILILGIFKVLSYILYRKKLQFLGTFALQNAMDLGRLAPASEVTRGHTLPF